jgi:hypothetical protein
VEKSSPEPTHFLPLKPPPSESIKVVFRNFDHFRMDSPNFEHDEGAAILDGMEKAFQSNYLCDAPVWNLSVTKELVNYFLSYPNPKYPKMLKEWYKETYREGCPVEDDKRVLTLLTMVGRKIYKRGRKKIH